MDTRDNSADVYNRQALLQYSNHATTNLHDDVLGKIHDFGLL